jgi:hypothetical protein
VTSLQTLTNPTMLYRILALLVACARGAAEFASLQGWRLRDRHWRRR